jgi:hypothetical protein
MRTGEKPSEELQESLDWVLPYFDPQTTEAQSMEEELKRLQVLKSYLILDAKREEAFERITALAGRIFDVPIALVSLVDLGRQWFMSSRGLDVRETPRKLAFCARKSEMLAAGAAAEYKIDLPARNSHARWIFFKFLSEIRRDIGQG